MQTVVTVSKTYKYRLYRCDKKDRKLRQRIFVASTIWNHFIALQRRYYRLNGKYISLTRMNNHVLKLRKTQRFSLWRDLHSQVCQNVCNRVDDAYQRFFKGLAHNRPKFRKAKKYTSFTFPQLGYRVGGNKITMAGTTYKFVKHREMNGDIKTLTIKRDKVGRLWLIFSVREQLTIGAASTGKSGGFDFDTKAFLTDEEGQARSSTQVFSAGFRMTHHLVHQLSRKVKGSKRYRQKQRELAKHKIDVANKRCDHHFKLAHHLCDEFDVLYFEELNVSSMNVIWKRKVSELGFARFMSILEWVAFKSGKQVVKTVHLEPMTKTCSKCSRHHNPSLSESALKCHCGLMIQGNHNGAVNINTVGASTGYQNGRKSKISLRSRVDGSGLHL